MHFLEVLTQNVRGFSPAGRIALKQGYLILKPPAPATPAPLAGLALAVLYADGRGGEAAFLAPGQRAGKAALTLVGKDGATYRVLRELGGAGGLQRLNPTTQAQELITKDASEMAQFLRGQAGLVPRASFEQLCCLFASQLPSRRERPKAGAKPESKLGMPSVSSGVLSGGQAVTAATNIPAAEAHVRELERELVMAREVDQLQYQLDGINSQIFELDSKLQNTEGLERQLQQAESEWDSAHTPETLGLPEDILERAARFPKLLEKRDEALDRLHAEREAEVSRIAEARHVEPLTRDRNFWAALGLGVIFLLVGIIFRGGQLRYLALLDIPAFGAAAFFALRYVDELKQSQSVGRRDEMLAAREKKILEDYEAEASHVKQAMKATGVDSPLDLAAVLGKRAELEARVVELRNELEAMQSDPERQALAERQEELRAQAEELNAEVTEKGLRVREAREVERELSRLKESIALAKAPASPAGSGAPAASGAAGEQLEDPTPALFTQVADVLATDARSVAGMVRERFVQYLTALLDRRYTAVEWDKDSRAVLLAADGRKVPAAELSARDLDLYYLGLRLTVLERASSRVKLPLLVEDALTGVEDARLPLVGRMLKHLGTLTQVLHVTAQPGFAQLADGVANL